MNRADMHTRTGTHTHMGEPRDARDTCMGKEKWPICVWAAHTRMGQPIRVREKYAYGTEHRESQDLESLLIPDSVRGGPPA